jgi:hypothetical protein
MRSSKPPALATWLVEHMIPGGRNEALAGDLWEQFSQGRSVTWYWRQVLVAILVGFLREWRMLAWAAGVTAAWAFPFYYGHLWNTPSTQAVFGLGIRRPLPLALLSATAHFTSLAILPLSLAVGIYAVMTTDLTTKQSLRKPLLWLWLLKGYLSVAFSTLLLLVCLPAWRHPILVGNIVGLLPVFLGMLVSVWALRRDSPRKGTAKLFRIEPPRW